MRSLGQVDLRPRLGEWVGRLNASAQDAIPARDLYRGEHWAEFRKVLREGLRSGVTVQGWVISAGYGLISIEASLAPYSASFSREASDRVAPPEISWTESDWWRELACWEGPVEGAPRTLTQLGARTDGELILVAVSSSYLRAIEADLHALLILKPEVLVFSSSSPESPEGVGGGAVAFDSRLREVVGGSQVALNIRTLGYALREAGKVEVGSIRDVVREAMGRIPPVEPHHRRPATDTELLRFIRSELVRDPRAKPTPLLRRWRSMDRACEQSRFKSLFREAHQTFQAELPREAGSA
jgi:hypothetical protein